jgi:hypothetical protein
LSFWIQNGILFREKPSVKSIVISLSNFRN